jgi:hypothetical protein
VKGSPGRKLRRAGAKVGRFCSFGGPTRIGEAHRLVRQMREGSAVVKKYQPAPVRENTHRCPKRGCTEQVRNSLFACGTHWAALPVDAKEAIRKTASLNILHPTRRAAFKLADDCWEGR